MSGIEIVEEIEQETSRRWKPSPGSLYPLLAKLQEKGFTKESPIKELGMKRYFLTVEGKTFFKNQVKIGQTFLEKLEFLAPILIGGFQSGTKHKNLHDAREHASRLLKTFIHFRSIKDSLTKQNVEEIVKILDNCDKQLKKVAQRIEGKNSSAISNQKD